MSRNQYVGLIFLSTLLYPIAGSSQEGGDPPSGVTHPPLIEREVRDTERIPLRHIEVDARVTGSLAEVTVEQLYENRLQGRVEAIYVFPLPDDAAVNELIMIIGERRIVADLRERDAARRQYEQARDRGQSASLLEQERPNVFTMSVANIQPGQPIRVMVRYVEQLPYRDGHYHFHFPTVVGPRFIPGNPVSQNGSGVLPDTDRVHDASRITPSVLPQGVRTPYQVDFNLDLQAPMALRDLNSGSHNLAIQQVSDQHVTAGLLDTERQPNRDIEISYALASDAPALGFLSHYDREQGGFFSLMLEPPLDFSESDVRPKELVFVLDASGSMSGYPIETAKEVVRHALSNLNSGDTFQIIRFSDASSGLSPVPLPNTPANVSRGISFVNTLSGEGGTNMTAGITAALARPPDPERMRIVLFLTDGYIGNETEILSQIGRQIGRARLFSLGVGSSVNRYLLDRMADVGRGSVQYVNIGEPPNDVVSTFYGRFRNPILTEISIDWGGLDVAELVPSRIPDVFSGTPITVAGRFRRGGRATVTVRGKHGRRQVAIPLRVNFDRATSTPAVAHIWARRQIDALELRHAQDLERMRAAVLPLALRFHIMSQFTSFVAVEDRISADASEPLTAVAVPVALPEGTSAAGMGLQVQQPPTSPFNQGVAGSDPENALGALIGNQIGDNFGYGGLGLRGSGRGGGGTGSGSIGLSNLNSIGHGGGGGSGSGYGHGRGGLRGRRASVPQIQMGTATIRGSLSRDVIRRYIRRNINQIRYCYEQQLARDPSLSGRVTVRFVIGPDGRVTSVAVASSTLGSPEAEQCVARMIQRITFPAVEGGGVVVVTYPFNFQPDQQTR